MSADSQAAMNKPATAGAVPAAKPSTAARAPAPISAWLVIAYSVIGIGIAGYLTAVHYAKLQLACSNTGIINCTQVTQSPYSVIGNTNIPITVPGMAWFIVSASLAGIAIVNWLRRSPTPDWVAPAHMLWALAGLAFVLYLVYAEAVLIKAFCEWCSGVHVLVILTFLTVLFRWQRMMSARYARA